MKKSILIEDILTHPKPLSAKQREAVVSNNRYVRIMAGAGAGKTETLTRRIAYLLLIENVQPSEIVAFTFTEKAAQSLKNRIYQSVELLADADLARKLGEMFIGTIHSYAKRLLDDHFNTGNYTVLNENQEIAFLMRHGWQLELNEYGNNYVEACLNFLRTVSMAWDEVLDVEELKRRAPVFHGRMTQYARLLDDHHLLTFGRMMNLAAVHLIKHPGVVSYVKHLIVDEYQDINQAQAVLIEAIGITASLFVVGDPRQSIYQWRGSNERFFSRFEEKYPEAHGIEIVENRRSMKAIVDTSNHFSDTFETIRYEHTKSTRTEDGFVGLLETDTPEDEAAKVVNSIEHLVNNNDLDYSDIGILMRSVTTSGGPILEELRRRKIPFIVGGKVGLFRRGEAQALGRIFAWFWSEGFWVADSWKWNDKILGDDLIDSALELWSEALGSRVPTDAKQKLIDIKMDLLSGSSKVKNFTEIFHLVLIALGFKQLSHEDRNDIVIMANIGRFNELLTDYEIANRLGGHQPRWDRDLKGLCWYMNSYATRAYSEGTPEDSRGIDAIQVMTVHQAKGLEWPAVFIISMNNGRFPSSMVGRVDKWCGVPRNMFDVTRYEGGIEDERRLFYVALTRARDMLVISHFNKMKRSVKRSIFIDDIDSSPIVTISDESDLPGIGISSQSLGEDEIMTFSAGEIITFERCPYMYLLGNIWGYQPGLSYALGYGNGLHHCLRRASEMVKAEGLNPASAVATAVEEDFHMPFASGKVFNDFKENALETLVNFSDRYSDDFGRIEEIEYRLEYPVHGATITGRVDVMLRDGGNFEVRDYKTSEEARTFEETSTQIMLYSLGLNGLGRNVIKGSVAYLEEATVKEVTISEIHLEDARKRAEGCIKQIRNDEFGPRTGDNCRSCDHKSICRWS